MSQQLLDLNVADSQLGTKLRDGGVMINSNFTELFALQSQTINASAVAYGFPGGSTAKETAINSAINDAVSRSLPRVYVPDSMYPYITSAVTFSPTVKMVREGGDPNAFDIMAYGADPSAGLDATLAGQAAVNAAAIAAAVGGATVYFPPGLFKISSQISVPEHVTVRGAGGQRATQIISTVTGTDTFLFGGTNTVLYYGCGIESLAIILVAQDSGALRFKGCAGAYARCLYIEGPTNNYGTRTNTGVVIDAGNASSFFCTIDSVECNHMHNGFRVESTGTSYATCSTFINCSGGGDRTAGDSTSIGFLFTRPPVVTPAVGNGEGSVIIGGDVENYGTGIQIDGGGIAVYGTRYEANTLDVLLGGSSGNNTFRDSSTLTRAKVSDAGTNNLIEIPSERTGAWFPTIVGTVVAGTQTYTSQGGTFVKNGRQVTCNAYVRITAKDVAIAGDVQIGGFPYAAVAGIGFGSAGVAQWQGVTMPAGTTQLGIQMNASNTTAALTACGSGTAATSVPVGNIAAATYLIFTMTYITSY